MNKIAQTGISVLVMSAVYFGIDYKDNSQPVMPSSASVSNLPNCLASTYWFVNTFNNYLFGTLHHQEYDNLLNTHCLLKSNLFVNTIDDGLVTVNFNNILFENFKHVFLDSDYNEIYKNQYVMYNLQNHTAICIYLPPHSYDDVNGDYKLWILPVFISK